MATGLEFIGVGVSIHTIIQTCFHYQKFISEKLHDINSAEEQLKEFTLCVELSLSHLEETLNLVEHQSQSSLDPRTSSILLRVLVEICDILGKSDSKLSRCFNDTGGVKRVRFALVTKATLEQFQKEIDTWIVRLSNRLFLHWMSTALQPPSTSQIEPGAQPATSSQTTQHVAIQALELKSTALPDLEGLETIEYSNACLGELPGGRKAVVEFRYFGQNASFGEKMFTKQSNRNIATMLVNAHAKVSISGDPLSKGMLECAGFFSDDSRLRCGIVSKLPNGLTSPPKSLQSLLWSPENRRGSRHDLNDRISLARSIAFSALAMHSAKFVHKNIRPSNILVLDPQTPGSRGYPYTLGRPVIVGFDDARPDDEETERRGSLVWQDNIYRHPQRQPGEGKDALDYSYTMMHDIYSLGIVFTEIAFWRPSVLPKKNESTGRVEIIHNPEFWGSLLKERKNEKDAEEIRKLYLKLVKGGVSKHIGGCFAQVIETCLNCLDEPGEESAAALSDKEIGIAFIERVVEALEAISL